MLWLLASFLISLSLSFFINKMGIGSRVSWWSNKVTPVYKVLSKGLATSLTFHKWELRFFFAPCSVCCWYLGAHNSPQTASSVPDWQLLQKVLLQVSPRILSDSWNPVLFWFSLFRGELLAKSLPNPLLSHCSTSSRNVGDVRFYSSEP